MATLTIRIPDGQLSRVANAFADAYGWTPTIRNPADPNGPAITNPETKTEHLHRKIREYVKEVTIGTERRALQESIAIPLDPGITG